MPSSSLGVASPHGITLESEKDFRNFLKLARPEWSNPRRRGNSDIARVIEKLRSIGVHDTETLVEQIDGNTINEQLNAMGHVRLSREAIEGIRKNTHFHKSLDVMDRRHVREVGSLSPAAQLLSGKRTNNPALGLGQSYGKSASSGTASAASASSPTLSKHRGSKVCASSDGRDYLLSEDSTGDLTPLEERSVADPSIYGGAAGDAPSVQVRLRDNVKKARKARKGLKADKYTVQFMPSDIAHHDNDEIPDGSQHWALEQRRKGSEFTEHSSQEGFMRTGPGLERHISAESFDRQRSRLAAQDGKEAFCATKYKRTGQTMQETPLQARWLCSTVKPNVQQCEEMLKEQEAFDERDRLLRIVHASSEVSEMRSYVAAKIRSRLQKEKQRDPTQKQKDMSLLQQKSINVRKNLTSMVNLRRDVNTMRTRVLALDCGVDTEDGGMANRRYSNPSVVAEAWA